MVIFIVLALFGQMKTGILQYFSKKRNQPTVPGALTIWLYNTQAATNRIVINLIP